VICIPPPSSEASIAGDKHPVVGITHHRNEKGLHLIVVANLVKFVPFKMNPLPFNRLFLSPNCGFTQMQRSFHFFTEKA
jgi:hypothetical protein